MLALIYAGWRLRRYFQAHQVEVVTSCLIKQVLLKLKTSGRLAKWEIKLGEHDISYRPHTSIKGQVIVDFLLEAMKETPFNLAYGTEAMLPTKLMFLSARTMHFQEKNNDEDLIQN